MLERVRSVASLGIRHLGAYGDLVVADLSVASAALGRRLWVGAVLAIATLIFVEIACFWVVAFAWDTPNRHWAIGSLAAFFLLVASGAAIALRALGRRQPGALSLSAREWAKDRELLNEFLGPAPEGTP